MAKLKTYISSLRQSRVWHRYLGLFLATLLVISSITGILLALKKEVALIQPPTEKGTSKELNDWKSVAELAQIAAAEFHQAYPEQSENKVDRIDVRPSKGIAKVLFETGYWEVQIDGVTGEVKSIAQRHSDWIEALHDGSIVSDGFKLVSMNTLGFGVLFLIGSGLWLYFGPKKVRRMRR